MFSAQEFIDGRFILIDKPKGWTSFDVIAKLRGPLQRYTGEKKLKIGHTGTLDPMATGLLVIATGRFTKQIANLQELDKEYRGVIQLGGITASYDAETPVIKTFPTSHLTDEQVRLAVSHFTGEIEQVPPAYSSIKMGGVRAYKKAREGETVEMKPRKVVIHKFEILKIEIPQITFEIACSKGTYIRSIAHDFGGLLNCGGYLTELQRTKVGEFDIADAMTIESFLQQVTQ